MTADAGGVHIHLAVIMLRGETVFSLMLTMKFFSCKKAATRMIACWLFIPFRLINMDYTFSVNR